MTSGPTSFFRTIWLVPVAACAGALAGCVHVASTPIDPRRTAESHLVRTLQDPDLQAFLHDHLGPSTQTPDGTWTFSGLSWAAFYLRSDLAVARADWNVALAAAPATTERPNPTVSVNPGYNSNSGAQSPWFPSIDLDLPLTGRTKRTADRARAVHLADARRLEVAVAAWRLRAELWQALVAWSAAQARVDASAAVVHADETLTQLWTQRIAAGAAATGDNEAALARLNLAQSREAVVVAEQSRLSARQQVAAALGISVHAIAAIRLPNVLDSIPAADSSPLETSLTTLQTTALRERSDVKAALADYAAAQSTLELEVARQYPDIHLGPGYQWDQGASKWSLVGTFEWPIFSRNRAAIDTAVAQRQRAYAHFEDVQAQVLAQIEQAATHYHAAAALVTAVAATRAAQSAELNRLTAQLQLGGADRIGLAFAERALASHRLVEVEARTELAAASGELESALQPPFADFDRLLSASPASPTP